MTWQHVVSLFIGAGLAVGGFFIPGANAALVPLGMTIIGGVLGHATAETKKGGNP